MAAYYFHVTDGSTVEVDRRGEDARGRNEARRMAGEKACALMAARGPSRDWSTWAMHVYDDRGREVAAVPFAEADIPALHTPGGLARRIAVQNLGRFADRVGSRKGRA